MTDLRAALIEAGAEALDGRPLADLDGAASAVLDVVLDVLADRADEWETAYWGGEGFDEAWEEGRVRAIARRLVAVLRGDTEE